MRLIDKKKLPCREITKSIITHLSAALCNYLSVYIQSLSNIQYSTVCGLHIREDCFFDVPIYAVNGSGCFNCPQPQPASQM